MSLPLRVYAQSVRDRRLVPAAEAAAAGRALLAVLLRHAAGQVPRYRRHALALEAAADGDANAWSALPIASREDLSQPDAFAARLPDGETMLAPGRTWTTLATPLDEPSGTSADIADRAQWEALVRDAGIDTSGRLVAVLPARAIAPGDLAEAFGPWSIDAHEGRANRWPDGIDMRASLAWLANVRPDCLFAGPAWVRRLCEAAEPGQLSVRDVLVRRPAPGLAALCRRVLGARLVEALASPLCGFVARPCADGGFAADRGAVLVEIVDSAGRPCRSGEAGRLIVTALHSHHRPVIRHDLGLAAAWAEDGGDRPFDRARFRLLG